MNDFNWYKYIGKYPTAWEGHLLYIYNQIPEWKPETIVELGVHWGHSFFTMCESCLDHDMNTKLYGIDHWKGDEHAGKFDENVWDTVQEVAKEYPNATLIRKDFTKAHNEWDKPIDLLHIDGRHFYGDIKEDFDNWSDFVPSGGHIILHDTQVTDRGFGIKKFFAELREQHPDWEFSERLNSNGLGIILKKS